VIARRHIPVGEFTKSLHPLNLLQNPCSGYGNLVFSQKLKSSFGYFFKIDLIPESFFPGRIFRFPLCYVHFVRMQTLRISSIYFSHVTSVSVSGGI
jgi:hypothetical protein